MSFQTKAIAVCPRCGASLHPAVVKTTRWAGEVLYALEDVPAQVCDSCATEFYDEETTAALSRLKANLAHAKPRHEILVPVFSLEEYFTQ